MRRETGRGDQHEIGLVAVLDGHALGMADDPQDVPLPGRSPHGCEAAQHQVHVTRSGVERVGTIVALDDDVFTESLQRGRQPFGEVPIAPAFGHLGRRCCRRDHPAPHARRRGSGAAYEQWPLPLDRRAPRVAGDIDRSVERRTRGHASVVVDRGTRHVYDAATGDAQPRAEVDAGNVVVEAEKETTDPAIRIAVDDESPQGCGGDISGRPAQVDVVARATSGDDGFAAAVDDDVEALASHAQVVLTRRPTLGCCVHERGRGCDHVTTDRLREARHPTLVDRHQSRRNEAEKIRFAPFGFVQCSADLHARDAPREKRRWTDLRDLRCERSAPFVSRRKGQRGAGRHGRPRAAAPPPPHAEREGATARLDPSIEREREAHDGTALQPSQLRRPLGRDRAPLFRLSLQHGFAFSRR